MICAYNHTNGEPACANKRLFDILRREWRFGGHVVSVEAAERSLLKSYPFITRLSDEVPRGVEAHRGLVYARYGMREMRLDLFKPEGAGPFPTVILVHGGAWITGDHKMENPFAVELARRGYLAATAECRLSQEAKYPAAVHDLKASVRWLRANAARGRGETLQAMRGELPKVLKDGGGVDMQGSGNVNAHPAFAVEQDGMRGRSCDADKSSLNDSSNLRCSLTRGFLIFKERAIVESPCKGDSTILSRISCQYD